jgi:ATP-dependent DNA helicase RecG
MTTFGIARAPSRAGASAPAAVQKKLARLGIHVESDAVLHLPFRYEDETHLTPIGGAASGGPCQIEGTIIRADVKYRPRPQLVVQLADATGTAWLRFMTFYPSQKEALGEGRKVRAFGELRGGLFGAEMVHPRFRVLRGENDPLPDALTPVYPTIAGLSQAVLRRFVLQALDHTDLDDTLPEAWLRELGLCDFAFAVRTLHRPPPDAPGEALTARTHPAWRRIKFDELLAQQLSMRTHYRARLARRSPQLTALPALTRKLLHALPFTLTRAQRRVWDEVQRDLAQPYPMNRLLQGDVGSGKTIVAALAALRCVESGRQAVVMAPTEILAEQHYRKFHEWLAPLGVEVAWVAGAQKRRERRAALERLQANPRAIAIGTHALIEESVALPSLGLAVVDEQHRFGVRQRLALREKGVAAAAKGAGGARPPDLMPHLLMMSATPIPRTLAMSYYADLDVSVIDELPPGRTPVRTKLIADGRRDEVIAGIRAACEAGEQAYWVCPLIAESEALDLRAATATHANLERELAGLKVALLHGKLPAAQKTAVIRQFLEGEVQVLVATTVIEVGVDVPQASLMVIEHAERFGLAQVHQLRGRVGRGKAASTCILLYQSPLSDTARARLKILFESTDGFRIAQEDLQLRGPGEFLGVRQSGVPLLRFADLVADQELLDAARKAADRLLEREPARAHAHMARWTPAAAALMAA